MQHVFRDVAIVLLVQKDEVIVGSADISLVAFLGGRYFLLQDGAYDFFTCRATLRISDLECLDVGRSEGNLSRYIRHRLRIVAVEYLIFPRQFVGLREGWVLYTGSLQTIEDRVQIWRGYLCSLRA